MMDIIKIAEGLNIDSRILKLVNREILLPKYIDDFNSVQDHWYPHPPCLVPLFLGHGASYTGVIKHFFLERESPFVEYVLEDGFISEIARNADQFITLIILKMIIIKDGLTDEIIDFCKSLDFEPYDQIDQFTLDYGDDPQEFKNLVFFKTEEPFKYIRQLNGYNGDFPSSLSILNENSYLKNAAYLEIAATEKLGEIEDLPPWLVEGNNKKNLFDFYLAGNQLKEAWLTLNSKHWLLKDVANCLAQLKKKADDDLFASVADYWIAGWKKSDFLDNQY